MDTRMKQCSVIALYWSQGSIVQKKCDGQMGMVMNTYGIPRAQDGSRYRILVSFFDGEQRIYTIRSAHRLLEYVNDGLISCVIALYMR